MKRFLSTILVAMFAITLSGCGDANNDTPAPAPAPVDPNAGRPPYGAFGSCGQVGSGQPLNGYNTPYYTNLTSSSTGSSANTLSLSLFYATTNIAEYQLANIAGSGNLVLQDLAYLTGSNSGQSNICVSSVNPQNGAQSLGTFDRTYAGISLTMTGVVQLPYYSPYSYNNNFGYGTPPAMAPVPITVEVGSSNGCQAYLREGRIKGCVIITIGELGYGQSYYYEADASTSGYGGGYYW